MALPALASVADLEEWLGAAEPLDGPDATRATAYLGAASRLVRSKTGRAWLVAGDELDLDEPSIDENDLEIARSIVVEVAARKWQNPAGVVQETTGPFSSTFPEAASLGIYLTEVEEAQLLDFRVDPPKPKLWTLATTRGPIGLESDYVDVLPPGKPLPVDYP